MTSWKSAIPMFSGVIGLIIATTIMMASKAMSSPPPTIDQARSAIARSLPFIENTGTEWMAAHDCNSCHVVTFQIWSHTAAAAQGFPVDAAKVAEWTRWALADAHSDRYWFKLRPFAMEALKQDGVNHETLDKLQPMVGKIYTSEKLYLDAMVAALGEQDFARQKQLLVKRATLPNNGGGPDTLAQLLLGRKSGSEDKAVADSFEAVRALLLEWQNPDGSWNADGQLPALRWDSEKEMNDATTMWSLLALGSGGDDAVVRSRERALDYLHKAGPGRTVQSLALRLIVAHEFGNPDQAETLGRELLDLQNPDGGWSWWQHEPSNAFATGQALYALGRTGRTGGDPAVAKAWRFLIDTQSADGSWDVPQEAINTRARKLNVYTFWGTAWATIGMLQTLSQAAF